MFCSLSPSLAYLWRVNQWSIQSTWKRCMQASLLTFSPALKSDEEMRWQLLSDDWDLIWSTYLSCRWHNWWSPSLIPANHNQTISTSQTGEITWGPSPRSQCRPPSCSCGWRWRAPVCSWTVPRPDCSSSEPDCEPRQAHCDGQRCPASGLGWPGAPGTSSAGRAESCHRNHRSLGNGRIILSILPVLRHLCRQA